MSVCIVLYFVWGMTMYMKEGRRWKVVPKYILLLSKIMKGLIRLNVPKQSKDHYQKWHVPSQHSHCGGDRDLTQVKLLYNLMIRRYTPLLLLLSEFVPDPPKHANHWASSADTNVVGMYSWRPNTVNDWKKELVKDKR